jgi:hypothetical protein
MYFHPSDENYAVDWPQIMMIMTRGKNWKELTVCRRSNSKVGDRIQRLAIGDFSSNFL